MFGNGFRRDIWNEFVTRFNIAKITEFYASTEGNANMGMCIANQLRFFHLNVLLHIAWILVNYDNKLGATGIIPPWLEKVYPIALVRVNKDTGEVVRDPKTGFLVRCEPDEVGELIGKVIVNSPFRDFKGFVHLS